MDKLKDIWFAIIDKIKDILDYFKEHKKARIVAIIALVIIAMGVFQSVKKAQETAKQNTEIAKQAEQDAQDATKNDTDDTDTSGKTSVEADFDLSQKNLIAKYGKPKDGYYWDDDGNLVARGDKNKKATDVGRLYMQSVSKLDAKQLEKYAFNSSVLKTFNKFYSSDSDYTDQDLFKISTYKTVMKSIQVTGVSDNISYASDKMVITYNVKYIDLSYRGFWTKDRDKLFSNMLETTLAEQDKSKIKKYLYDYITNYYNSESPSYRDGQVSLTLQKSQTVGWLVTNDKTVDSLGKFDDDSVENSPVGEIITEFESYYDSKEGQKPSWKNTNINDGNSSGTKQSSNDSNGDDTLQGDTGQDASNPFN